MHLFRKNQMYGRHMECHNQIPQPCLSTKWKSKPLITEITKPRVIACRKSALSSTVALYEQHLERHFVSFHLINTSATNIHFFFSFRSLPGRYVRTSISFYKKLGLRPAYTNVITKIFSLII